MPWKLAWNSSIRRSNSSKHQSSFTALWAADGDNDERRETRDERRETRDKRRETRDSFNLNSSIHLLGYVKQGFCMRGALYVFGCLLVVSIGTYAQLPTPALVGYWHNWNDANAPYRYIDSVDDRYNVIDVAFAVPVSNTDMTMTFVPDRGSNQEFITRIQRVQQAGKKVLLSVGGATASIDLTTTQNRDAFVTSMSNLLKTFGFDGMDVDIEHGASILVNGGTIASPQAAAQKHLIEAIKSIMAQYRTDLGRKMLLTFAPETAYVQGGQSGFGNIWGGYLPIIDALRDSLDLIHVQLYNSGTMYGVDKNIYAQGTADFIVAMTEAVIKGFNTQGGNFAGVAASKVAVGLPASVNAAGGGYVDSTTINRAVNYLLGKGTKPGTYTLAQAGGYPDLRGMMTWSINWDATVLNRGTYDYADVYHALFGTPPLAVPDKVTLLSPTSNEQLRTNDVVLRWVRSKPSVTSYHVEVTVNLVTVHRDTAYTDTTLTLRNLQPGSTATWRVRAKNASGWGPWSDQWSFRTVPFPAKVQQLAPTNNEQLTSNTASFRWRKSQPDVSQYRLVITTPIGLAIIDTIVADTTFTIELPQARIYMWRVVARNISGWGEWSPMWTFMTVPYPDQVQLVTPADSALISVDSAALTWNKSMPIVDRYHLEVTTNGSVTLSDTLVKDTSSVVKSLVGRSTIRWRVRARNLSGWGPWSRTRQLRYLPLPAKVRLVTPADSAMLDSGAIDLSWTSPETDVTAYRIEVYRDMDLVFSDSTLTLRQVSPGTVPFNTWHRWRVTAKNLSGWGQWSEWRAFMIHQDTTTSADETEFHERPIIYPNPATNWISVRFGHEGSGDMQIFDLHGNLVQRISGLAGKPLVTIDIADLPAGVYLLQRGSTTCRLIKQ
ncbi:MAG: T9SS type A sorting domain-containing protein [Candidatus Kapabacteria bacterium]|nr:T9SS type A sorting domain-containing protein [Candidatus Kapabacteria bacterium]